MSEKKSWDLGKMSVAEIDKAIDLVCDRVEEYAKDQMFGMGNDGLCVACGDDRDGCEPDAREYPCFSCGENAVYGACELLMYL